jgi:hypothetical protein
MVNLIELEINFEYIPIIKYNLQIIKSNNILESRHFL